MEATSNALFSIGPLEVTKTVVTMWVIIVVLGLVSWLATRRLKMVPGPIQSAAEMAVTKLQDYFTGTMGRDNARRYFPVMATFFIFIVVSNYSGILPGAGHGQPVHHGGPGDYRFLHHPHRGREAPGRAGVSEDLHFPLYPDAAPEPY